MERKERRENDGCDRLRSLRSSFLSPVAVCAACLSIIKQRCPIPRTYCLLVYTPGKRGEQGYACVLLLSLSSLFASFSVDRSLLRALPSLFLTLCLLLFVSCPAIKPYRARLGVVCIACLD